MVLFLSQKPDNGCLRSSSQCQFIFSHEDIEYKITVEQSAVRQITISSSPEKTTSRNLLNVFYSLDTLLMLFDGQFYPVNVALENNVDITPSFQNRIASYKSADFVIGAGNILIDYENILSSQLLKKLIDLREELDLIHNMVLYCLSNVTMPVDMKCAFLTESFLGLSELANEKNVDFSLPTIHKRESKLKKYLTSIIEFYGQDIFNKECEKNKEQFAKIIVDSRNRIAHIKSKQNQRYLSGSESVLYLGKLSLLYRVVLFNLLEIPRESYNGKLRMRTDALNQWQGILSNFLQALSDK